MRNVQNDSPGSGEQTECVQDRRNLAGGAKTTLTFNPMTETDSDQRDFEIIAPYGCCYRKSPGTIIEFVEHYLL